MLITIPVMLVVVFVFVVVVVVIVVSFFRLLVIILIVVILAVHLVIVLVLVFLASLGAIIIVVGTNGSRIKGGFNCSNSSRLISNSGIRGGSCLLNSSWLRCWWDSSLNYNRLLLLLLVSLSPGKSNVAVVLVIADRSWGNSGLLGKGRC